LATAAVTLQPTEQLDTYSVSWKRQQSNKPQALHPPLRDSTTSSLTIIASFQTLYVTHSLWVPTSLHAGCASSRCAPDMYDGAQCSGSSVSAILPGHHTEYCRRCRLISATARRPSARTSAPVISLQRRCQEWDLKRCKSQATGEKVPLPEAAAARQRAGDMRRRESVTAYRNNGRQSRYNRLCIGHRPAQKQLEQNHSTPINEPTRPVMLHTMRIAHSVVIPAS
jgi:hypothetical protein